MVVGNSKVGRRLFIGDGTHQVRFIHKVRYSIIGRSRGL